MKTIPKTVTQDAAQTSGERLGQYNEQLSAYRADLELFLSLFDTLEQRSAFLQQMHEDLRVTMTDMFAVCPQCEEPAAHLCGELCDECFSKTSAGRRIRADQLAEDYAREN